MKTITQNIKQIPYLLTYSRLLMALYLVLITFVKPLQSSTAIIIVLFMALLSDISDDNLARKFKCYSVHLRQLNSRVNIFFWLALTFVLLSTHTEFMKQLAVQIFILFASEIAIQIYGFFKFNTTLALQTYSAKVWAMLLTLVAVILLTGNDPRIIFNLTFIWGLLVQLESLLIILKMKVYKVDVKSLFHI